ncbi:ROK family protein [Paenibacillus antri]|uniref:ROK family protein n=1 Tax=Paenibacillus antri TaxID=2582848 RepID=A0A5R9GMS1_9BACL|nr:ROK family protein [Paenibacillus antri]TLS53285.1 ROK family protein [Paenibacillus antri]
MIAIKDRIGNAKAKTIYGLVRKYGTVSKQLLQEQSEMKGSTLTRLLEDMTADGWIEEVGFGESTGGRRPILYRLRAEQGYVFGLDISRIHSRLVLCDLSFRKLDSRVWKMTASSTPEVLIQHMTEAMEHMLDIHGIPKERLLGVGVGGVGPLDRQKGVITNPLYFPSTGWNDVPVCRMISSRMGVPCSLDNGANAALLGEYWTDAPEERGEHVLYIHGGIGLRSAMLSNGKLVYGAVDMEGAVGQMIIQTDGVPHREPDGNYGCLESYASIYALEQAAVSRLKQGRESALRALVDRPEQLKFEHLVEAIHGGDPLTQELFIQSATYFGIGLANMLNMLHPEKVILGGPMFNTQNMYFETATQVAIRNTYYYPAYQVTFSRGKLGEEALAVGAAVMSAGQLTD